MKTLLLHALRAITAVSAAAQKNDSTVTVDNKTVTLSEVVINNKLNIPLFIDRIKNDSSFYKAFRNLHDVRQGFTKKHGGAQRQFEYSLTYRSLILLYE